MRSDNEHDIRRLCRQVLDGQMTVSQLMERLRGAESLPLPTATLDIDRQRRCGYPEVVYAENKSVETLKEIFGALSERSVDILATRVAAEKALPLEQHFPDGRYNAVGRTFRIPARRPESKRSGRAAIVTAGTSDLNVAEECRETLDWMGVEVHVVHDVGVAGPQRLLGSLKAIRTADAVVVIAGMEGALPSVVGGHVACPVVAVPTSVGYGANFAGVAALLGMLNSCAANVAVVNIDAGFKAGYVAGLIASRCAQRDEGSL